MSEYAWGEYGGWKEQEIVYRRTGTVLLWQIKNLVVVELSHGFIFSSEVLYVTCFVVILPG